MQTCKICGSESFETAYEGRIRTGKFGTLSDGPVRAERCRSCLAISLPGMDANLAMYYESEAYRQDVDEGATVQDYFRQHDEEQERQFSVVGTSLFRNKVVADVGCGAGSFLDYIRGVCRTAIAVEPAGQYRKSLSERGYIVYPYASDALREHENAVDIVVGFSVIEHIEDPLGFLKEIHGLLKKDGKLVISTPNADDVLLSVIPEEYGSFFYRKAHLWYFNGKALENLLLAAGFPVTKIIPFHRFGMGNFINWVREKAPKGDARLPCISGTMDAVWKAELQRTWTCDYLYAIGTKSDP
jgi:2-polyprenyl-3-methyl-5-hydroxy-6-metoxy-1,4-benzoquinol methylase